MRSLNAHWVSCFSALVGAIGLLVAGIVAWPVLPKVAIGMLMLAMLAVVMALWNYNQARFHDRTPLSPTPDQSQHR